MSIPPDMPDRPQEEVPSKSYPRQYHQIWPEIQAALERAFFDDDPILGEAVTRLEVALATWHEVPAAVAVASGTAALELTLRELDIGAGDEVITCAHTFTGTVNAIVLAGATPVLVDADEVLQGPGTPSQGLSTSSQGPGTSAQGPGTSAQGLGTSAQGLDTSAQGLGTSAQGLGTSAQGLGTSAQR